MAQRLALVAAYISWRCHAFSVQHDVTRRHILATAPAILLLQQQTANAAMPAESSSLPIGLLESRVSENILAAPMYGMEKPDISYPAWLGGTWNVQSKTIDVLAPCGVILFGGNNTYTKARNDIGNILSYDSRFVSIQGGSETAVSDTSDSRYAIADREYNVKSIAKAAIGPNSVIDVPIVSPNKISCILSPPGAPYLIQADLFTIARRQERVSVVQFDCSEVVREIVAPAGGQQQQQQQQSRLLKEIETTSLYTYHPDTDTVTCRQRSAAFLLPSQQNAMAMKMWEVSRGRAVDVRYYELEYKRKQ